MFRFSKLSLVAAVLAGAAILVAPGLQARAALSVKVFDDGVLQSGISVIATNNSLVFSGTTTNFDITNGSATSNYPGTQTGSRLGITGAGAQVTTAFGAGGGTHTLEFVFSEQGFTAPTANQLTLSSSAGGSIGGTGTSPDSISVASTYQGFLDNTNALYGEPASGSTPIQKASASVTGAGTNTLVFSPGTSASQIPGGTPFSMTDDLFFSVGLTGSEAGNFSVSASTVASVPEPTTMMAAFSAVPFLGLGAWLRRRKQAA